MPIVLSTVQDGTRLKFNWNLVETAPTAAFTLEASESLTDPVWQPVPGTWPAKTNAWTVDFKTQPSAFYRVAVTMNQN